MFLKFSRNLSILTNGPTKHVGGGRRDIRCVAAGGGGNEPPSIGCTPVAVEIQNLCKYMYMFIRQLQILPYTSFCQIFVKIFTFRSSAAFQQCTEPCDSTSSLANLL